MKLYKSFLLVAAFVGLFTSCSDESYWDAYDTQEETTYSIAQPSNSFKLKATDTLTQVVVTFQRNKNNTTDTIPLSIKANSGIISVAQDYTVFESGKYTSDLVINIDNDNIVMGYNYQAVIEFLVDSVKFFEHNYSLTGNNKYTLTFIKDYTWVPVGDVQYTEGLVSAFYGVQNLTYSVPAEQAAENHGYIRLIDPYGKAWPYNPNFSAVDNQKHYMTFNCEDPEGVYMDGIHYSGIEMSDGELRFMSMAYYYMQGGNSFEDVKAAGFCGTLSDDLVITFPAGAMLISEANYNGGAWYQSNKTGEFAVDLSTANLLE
ncbi:MAG: hypothetical protein IKJ23_04930 [Bacteroidaceae bacterium]|nr:hypothetical protein [Bacteroidaceae bacterium]